MDILADKFYEIAEKYKHNTAIIYNNNKVTYGELSNLVSKCSNLFLDKNIIYGDKIGIPMNNSLESIIIMLAALNLGLTLVPINPSLPINGIKKFFNTADVKHIVARSSFIKKLINDSSYEIKGKIICLDKKIYGITFWGEIDTYSNIRPVINNISGNESYIITMTSGSTGYPKPINLTQKNKFKRIVSHIELYNLCNKDIVMISTPMYHSLAERLVLIPLVIGATLVLIQKFKPDLWLQNIERYKVTFTIAVSAQINQIERMLSLRNKYNLRSLNTLVSSSSLLENDVKEKIVRLINCDIHEIYGTSETATITDINLTSNESKLRSVGKALRGVDIKIVDSNNIEVGFGEVGEIICRSELLCNGYYERESDFNGYLIDGYFKTGDLGYLDESGYLYFMGRKKELIITGGINVYPPDIENCIKTMEEIKECAAFAYPNKELGEIIAIAVSIKKGYTLNDRDIIRHCARNLADFQQPHKIFYLDNLPKNCIGKIDKIRIARSVIKNMKS